MKHTSETDMNQNSNCSPKSTTPTEELTFELLDKLNNNIAEIFSLSGDNLKLLADADLNKIVEIYPEKYSLDWMEDIIFCANEKLLEMQTREDAKGLLLALNCPI